MIENLERLQKLYIARGITLVDVTKHCVSQRY